MSLRINNLSKLYGEQKAVDNISFEAPKGTITGFLGPNGAGKSTTMKIATGFLSASSGEVYVCDELVEENPEKIKHLIGYLPEHNPLYLDMYVKEYLQFVAKSQFVASKQIKERVKKVIELCGLEVEQHKKTGALSKGYRQRVGLAAALIHNPEVLILDEPTTGLDPNQIGEIRSLIKDISTDKTVILSTHIMQEVQALCDKVVIINKGNIVADAKTADLKQQSEKYREVIVEFEEEVDKEAFEDMKGLISVVREDKRFVLKTELEHDIRPDIYRLAIQKSLTLVGLQIKEKSLEDIFKQLTQEVDA